MQKPGSITLSFRAKVLIPVLAFLFLVPVVTLSVMQHRVSAQFERDAARKLRTAERIFQSYLDKRGGFLQARYRNLVQEPRFRAIAAKLIEENNNLNEVKPTVEDFLKRTFNELHDEDPQVILFTTADDTFPTVVRDAALRGEDFHRAASLLTQATLHEGATNYPVVVKRRLYNAVSIPVMVNHDTVAALTVFVPIAEAAAREFAS